MLFGQINELDSNGSYSIVTSSFSPVGDRWAYAVSRYGSDWVSIHVRRTEQSWSTNGKNGEPEDIVTYVKHTDSIVWSSDGNVGGRSSIQRKTAAHMIMTGLLLPDVPNTSRRSSGPRNIHFPNLPCSASIPPDWYLPVAGYPRL